MDIKVHVDSIKSTRNNINADYNELLSMIRKYQEMIEDTKKVYDTDSATLYRKITIEYAKYVEYYLRNDFKEYVDKLAKIEEIYLNENALLESRIQGGAS